MSERSPWFETWFDTKYYHSLYKHRDENEAAFFIQRLLDHLQLAEHAQVMDLACGKGRHSLTLFDAGLRVVGLDLSQNSISHLKKKERPGLEFHQWDMRSRFQEARFDCIFNLFTSFGYFDSMEDNHQVIDAVSYGLRPGGRFVLDYLNAGAIDTKGQHVEEKQIDGYTFRTSKKVEAGKIIKQISVEDNNKVEHFIESVQLFALEDLNRMVEAQRMRVIEVFGDYDLGPYHPESSSRMILIAQKI